MAIPMLRSSSSATRSNYGAGMASTQVFTLGTPQVGDVLILVGEARNNSISAITDTKGGVWTIRQNGVGGGNYTDGKRCLLADSVVTTAWTAGDSVSVTIPYGFWESGAMITCWTGLVADASLCFDKVVAPASILANSTTAPGQSVATTSESQLAIAVYSLYDRGGPTKPTITTPAGWMDRGGILRGEVEAPNLVLLDEEPAAPQQQAAGYGYGFQVYSKTAGVNAVETPGPVTFNMAVDEIGQLTALYYSLQTTMMAIA